LFKTPADPGRTLAASSFPTLAMKLPKLLAAAGAAALLPLGAAAQAAPQAAATHAAPSTKGPPMQIQSSYPVIVTARLAESRDFYVRWLGFEVAFEATWFVYLAAGPAAIAFMRPDHPSQPPGPERFNGQGMFLTLQVADARAAFQRVKDAGAAITYPVRDEPWGQRRFGMVDPNGMWVDVVEQIEPAPGYWDKYMPR
jgi:catechol 2,3-dioxygenase-like lactoylglutathione lyase family enzyme